MILKREDLLKKYRVSYQAFYKMLSNLPEPVKKQLAFRSRKQYLNAKQLQIIKNIFGDWEKYSFHSKSELCALYGISSTTFRKMLVNEFGPDHEIIKATTTTKIFTAKQVEMIEQTIGEP